MLATAVQQQALVLPGNTSYPPGGDDGLLTIWQRIHVNHDVWNAPSLIVDDEVRDGAKRCIARRYLIARDLFRASKVWVSYRPRCCLGTCNCYVGQSAGWKGRFHTQVIRPSVGPNHAEFPLSRDRPVGVDIWGVLNLLFRQQHRNSLFGPMRPA